MKTEQNNEMSRRGFLKRTVLAGAAICIAPTVSYTHLDVYKRQALVHTMIAASCASLNFPAPSYPCHRAIRYV